MQYNKNINKGKHTAPHLLTFDYFAIMFVFSGSHYILWPQNCKSLDEEIGRTMDVLLMSLGRKNGFNVNTATTTTTTTTTTTATYSTHWSNLHLRGRRDLRRCGRTASILSRRKSGAPFAKRTPRSLLRRKEPRPSPSPESLFHGGKNKTTKNSFTSRPGDLFLLIHYTTLYSTL